MQLFKYNIFGFLHWGYNYYNNRASGDTINPYLDLGGEDWVPAGDTFIVYPAQDGTALESIRAITMDEAPESAKWKCREHKSFNKKFEGYVEVIQAEKKDRQASASDFFVPIENALNAVKPWERNIETAILVRTGTVGEKILAHLKSKGITKVVFEGDSEVSDTPVLSVMMDLV
jgi:hypothetical protein